MRKAVLIRFLICWGIGLLIAIPMSDIGFDLLGNKTSRPAKTIVLNIPANTSSKVAQGTRVLPQDMLFVVGDTLVVNNLDSVSHTLGPLFIPPGSSAQMTLHNVGYISLTCSFQPTKYQGLDVTAALTPIVWLEGIIIAGIPLGMIFALYSLILLPIKKGKQLTPDTSGGA